MRSAACALPDSIHYQRDLFAKGLRAAGFEVSIRPSPSPGPEDVLLIWNRRSVDEAHARRYEAVGAKVIVVENGYLGSETKPPRSYAIALSHHLGAGTWFVGKEDRWSALGIELMPWRRTGTHLLILPQRGIGEPGVAMPSGWVEQTLKRLRGLTERPIKIRRHPGPRPHPPMDSDLADSWAAVTWGSGAGIKAIIAGIPVFHDFPLWVGAPAARFGLDHIEDPFLGDRLPMLRRLAWAQCDHSQIENGEPFRCLLA